MSSDLQGFDAGFERQLRLLMQVLPELRLEGPLALKGGTAINLFFQDLPRLSVDLDLVYVPLEDRAAALQGIGSELESIAARLEQRGMGVQRVSPAGMTQPIKLVVRREVTVKLEVSPVLRGTVFPAEPREVLPGVEELYGYARVPVVSHADLYAGKIMAALDRQHPRDLFDVQGLLRDGELSRPLVQAFLVYLVSHDRPMSEVLRPHFKALKAEFDNQFVGTTQQQVTLEALVQTRVALLEAVHRSLTPQDRQFLISFKALEPRWDLLGLEHVQRLPAVRWKLLNLRKMPRAKHAEALKKLAEVLDLSAEE